MDVNRDDPILELYPQHGTFYDLVSAIAKNAEHERYQSDRWVNMSYERIVVNTEVLWSAT